MIMFYLWCYYDDNNSVDCTLLLFPSLCVFCTTFPFFTISSSTFPFFTISSSTNIRQTMFPSRFLGMPFFLYRQYTFNCDSIPPFQISGSFILFLSRTCVYHNCLRTKCHCHSDSTRVTTVFNTLHSTVYRVRQFIRTRLNETLRWSSLLRLHPHDTVLDPLIYSMEDNPLLSQFII